MKARTFKMVLSGFISVAFVVSVGMLFLSPTITWAAPGDNQGTGDIAGVAADLTDSAVFNLTGTQLAIVKIAFTDAGVQLTSGDTLPKGATVKFVLYVDNSTDAPANDVRIEDLLSDTDFTYTTGSLSWNNNVTATAATAATIYSDTDTGGSGVALTDTVSGADVGSADVAGSPDSITFGAHATQTNGTVNIPANTIVAFMLKATVN